MGRASKERKLGSHDDRDKNEFGLFNSTSLQGTPQCLLATVVIRL